MTFRRLLRFGVAALLSMALAGCWFTGEREHQAGAYVAALADSLAVAPQTSSIPTVEPLPRSRYRRQDLPELDMGLVDFLSLYGCDLQVVIGERTSTLGRVAPPGKRMAYHLRFLEAADDCLPKVESESRSKALEEARAARADSLPLALQRDAPAGSGRKRSSVSITWTGWQPGSTGCASRVAEWRAPWIGWSGLPVPLCPTP